MRSHPVLVFASQAAADNLRRRISLEARPGWEEQIKIRVAARSAPDSTLRPSTSIEEEISRACHERPHSRVLVEKLLRARTASLESEGIRVRACQQATILSELLDEIQRRRLHWLSHSVHEWEKAGIKYLRPEAWRQQFADLGYDWVGEGILKQLRVISDSELIESLSVPVHELVGVAVAHGCVLDDEPGSSSVNVKDMLEHTYTCKVLEIDFSRQPEDVGQIDHLYVYEDGLWSGVELVKRLSLLATWPAVRSRDLKVTFRFAATSEAGLLAARHFLQREKLTSVNVEVGAIHFRHMPQTGIERILKSRDESDDVVRRTIDAHIEPLAFRDDSAWLGRSHEALSFCERLGEQLVRPWIVRTKGPDGLDVRSKKWALGALGFASVTSFSKSVPKPVLPLLWLNGCVELDGRRVEWRPLFWDSRRTGAAPH